MTASCSFVPRGLDLGVMRRMVIAGRRSSLSEVSATRADRALLDLSEESMTRVGESVTTASSLAAS